MFAPNRQPRMAADPFGERPRRTCKLELALLGGQFCFESDNRRLLRLVELAFVGVPRQVFDVLPPRFHIRLRQSQDSARMANGTPPPAYLYAGGDLLCGMVDTANGIFICPETRTALVVISPSMLRHTYFARYELLEFAVFTLASKAQGLLSMHGACVGRDGRGLLLLGASGAGKSTLTLHCLLQGMEFLAEDSVHIKPDSLSATGVANFLHLRRDSARSLENPKQAAWIRESPVIRRRSGVEKYEVDLRAAGYRLARRPLELAGAIFVSARGSQEPALVPLKQADFFARLEASQPYAAQHPGWDPFKRRLFKLGAFELLRGQEPRSAAMLLNRFLGS